MARKKHKPTDPAEIARQRREREARTRSTPGEWGVNEDALKSQGDVTDEPGTRTTVRRVRRYSCFDTLGITRPGRTDAVSRLEDLIATRYHVDGVRGPGGVGSAETKEFRAIAAGDQIDAVMGWLSEGWMGPLLLALLTDPIVEGKRVNWHAVVKNRMGYTERGQQTQAVKKAAQALVEPFSRWDAGERPVKMRAAA